MQIKSIIAVFAVIMIIGLGAISQASHVFAESSESTTKDANVISLWDVKIENGKAILWAKVKNTGSEPLDSNCKVHFWVRGPDKWMDDYVGSRPCTVNDAGEDTGPVSPDESRWYKYEWTIPNNAKPGTYRYWVIVKDGSDKISEWSSGKDFTISTTSTSKSASVTELWDVTIKNGKAILWAKVKNTGTEPLDSNCKVHFWVLGPDEWINDYVGFRRCTVNDAGEDTGPVSPGESRWYKYEWTIPNNAKSGTHRYWVIVKDGSDKISEWSSGKDFTISLEEGKEFYHRSTSVSGSDSDKGGSGVGSSNGYIEGNNIKLDSRDGAWGTRWATGTVLDVFTYFLISDSFFLYINTYQRKLFDVFSYISRTIGHQSTDKICNST